MEWKNMGSSDVQNELSTGPVIKKQLPRKIRQIPECYFLPRRSIPSAIAFYGAWIAGGIGAGMLLEIWIKKKVKVPKPTFQSRKQAQNPRRKMRKPKNPTTFEAAKRLFRHVPTVELVGDDLPHLGRVGGVSVKRRR
ncbi:hypothetical protein RHSIM_Rhsim06G0009300 [Rhododendron simsii]|uniref:Transmembrane protein n=1 Tax=Rhododendron simsii TaxID=118357 RepID=A0A834GWQ4_RHOSS|nr:hypothetical protein RHSIM_Rhsim06G0009300 [Rhododendron simsii]